MNTPSQNQPEPTASVSALEHLSALCDGSIGAAELDALMDACQEESQPLERWHAYQVIGAVLRGNEPTVPMRGSADFLANLRSRLDEEAPVKAVEPVKPLPVSITGTPAANDGVFRWKLVAGFASMAAVAAVGWNLLATVPAGPVSGGQLAQSPVTAPAPTAVASAPTALPAQGQTVAVDTRQGTVIRDAGLERLLAEHRQHGGMSALQNPTGFIRNATYDADAR